MLSPVSVVALVGGVALLAVGGLAWSGLWRRWARPEPARSAPITVVPGVGVFLVTLGVLPLLVHLLGNVLVLLGFLAAIGSWLVLLSEPPWWGPRWWRERGAVRESSDVEEVLWARRVPPERDSEYLVSIERAPSSPRVRRSVLLLDPALGRPTLHHQDGAAPGSLLLFDDEVVFAADRRDDATRPGPTIRVLPAAGGLDVRREPSPRDVRLSSVVIVGADGSRCRFEVVRPRSLIAVLRRTYPSA
ncbi:hypothetical protein [Actinomycetospora termitidis]|uniref:Uncharacterized protein n=1 Tax=Actinomycetospora termitidis TaxID=3053470 RepID=A0ABT7MEJ4_9PSEU|nr:hypothetical protein [Actinomycetospora sp. Odt1-22]MDL5159085.1 hypothetical protein [Actinomycetospora sp. Odt1-22]